MALTSFPPSPFCCQGPIQDPELFFDRDVEAKQVLSRLRRCQSVSIVGEEKIGKTSLLYYVSNPQVAVRYSLRPQTPLFFYVDCKRLADLSEDDCFRAIKAIVEQTVSIWEANSAFSLQGRVSSNAYDWLDGALSLLEEEGVQPIIQLDGFKWLAHNDRLSLVFFSNLRALASTHDALAYLATSSVPLWEIEKAVSRIAGSPFFNIFRHYELQPFDPHKARTFLLARLALLRLVIPEVTLERICCLSQGKPHRLQLAGACVYDFWRKAGPLSEEHVGEIENLLEGVLR